MIPPRTHKKNYVIHMSPQNIDYNCPDDSVVGLMLDQMAGEELLWDELTDLAATYPEAVTRARGLFFNTQVQDREDHPFVTGIQYSLLSEKLLRLHHHPTYKAETKILKMCRLVREAGLNLEVHYRARPTESKQVIIAA